MNVVTTTEQLPYDDSPSEKCTKYTLRLAPTVIVNNLLPLMVDINLKESNVHFELKSGDEVELWNSKVSQSILNIRLEYSGVNWHCAKVLDRGMEELSAITLRDSSNPEHTLVNFPPLVSILSLVKTIGPYFCRHWIVFLPSLYLAFSSSLVGRMFFLDVWQTFAIASLQCITLKRVVTVCSLPGFGDAPRDQRRQQCAIDPLSVLDGE